MRSRKKRKKPISPRRPRLTMGRFVLLVSAASIAFIALATYLIVQFVNAEIPDVALLRTHYPVVRYQGPKKPALVSLQRSRGPGWVGLNEVSRAAVGAIVVSEDWAFYQHKGYDPAQIKEAIREDLEHGRFKRGASTITQQVVKNVFLEKDKTLWRKVKELYLAVQLEEAVGKRKILETYLNIAEWGQGIFGISQAARFYFGKHPSELTAKEGAFLAMLLPSPRKYSQSFRAKRLSRYAFRTVNAILGKMTQARFITEEERDQAQQAALSFEITPEAAGDRPDGGEEEMSTDDDEPVLIREPRALPQ